MHHGVLLAFFHRLLALASPDWTSNIEEMPHFFHRLSDVNIVTPDKEHIVCNAYLCVLD